MYGPSNLS